MGVWLKYGLEKVFLESFLVLSILIGIILELARVIVCVLYIICFYDFV